MSDLEVFDPCFGAMPDGGKIMLVHTDPQYLNILASQNDGDWVIVPVRVKVIGKFIDAEGDVMYAPRTNRGIELEFARDHEKYAEAIIKWVVANGVPRTLHEMVRLDVVRID